MSSIIMELKKFVRIAVVLAGFVSCQQNQDKCYIIQGEAQGSTYAVKYTATREIVTKTQTDSLLRAFDLSLSTYRPDSDISKINAGDSSIVVDDFFVHTFRTSHKIFLETNGFFDPTIGVLVNAYGFGPQKEKGELTSIAVDSLLQYVGFDKVKLNNNKTISKQYPQTYFDFNAIAQGYSVDIMAGFLKSKGIEHAIVEIGGEIFAFGQNTVDRKNWIVGIDNPLQTPEERTLVAKIKLKNLGMATSGNYRKVIIDSSSGNKFVHIINPKTGYPQKSNVLSATVLAPNCAEADGYATAFMVMTLQQTQAFLENRKDLYVLLLYADEQNEIQQFQTSNFKTLVLESF